MWGGPRQNWREMKTYICKDCGHKMQLPDVGAKIPPSKCPRCVGVNFMQPMDNQAFRQKTQDAAHQALDAKKAARFKLTPEALQTVQVRLEAARARIDEVLGEIKRRQSE